MSSKILKEMFNVCYYESLAKNIKNIYPSFNTIVFLEEVTENLENLELNQRLRKTTLTLKKQLPQNYSEALQILYQVIKKEETHYTNLIFPDYVALYGLEYFNLSMQALEYFTQFGTSEFAIRVFLKHNFQKTLKVMEKWSLSDNFHVRRLASEGSRSRLPWSFKLNEVIDNPAITKNILENLKENDVLYIKKSVANHINDISKDNERYALDLIKSWNLNNSNTFWIAKHAMRNLIKKGNLECLKMFGFEPEVQIEFSDFQLKSEKISLGENLSFSFVICSKTNEEQKIVIDYAIHYLKSGDKLSRKVFKLKTLLLNKSAVFVQKKQLFKDFSTRKHYLGKHQLEILINGKKYFQTPFWIK